jgi:hypothetical protein
LGVLWCHTVTKKVVGVMRFSLRRRPDSSRATLLAARRTPSLVAVAASLNEHAGW